MLVEAFKKAGIKGTVVYAFTEEDMGKWEQRDLEFMVWMQDNAEKHKKMEDYERKHPMIFKG